MNIENIKQMSMAHTDTSSIKESISLARQTHKKLNARISISELGSKALPEKQFALQNLLSCTIP